MIASLVLAPAFGTRRTTMMMMVVVVMLALIGTRGRRRRRPPATGRPRWRGRGNGTAPPLTTAVAVTVAVALPVRPLVDPPVASHPQSAITAPTSAVSPSFEDGPPVNYFASVLLGKVPEAANDFFKQNRFNDPDRDPSAKAMGMLFEREKRT